MSASVTDSHGSACVIRTGASGVAATDSLVAGPIPAAGWAVPFGTVGPGGPFDPPDSLEARAPPGVKADTGFSRPGRCAARPPPAQTTSATVTHAMAGAAICCLTSQRNSLTATTQPERPIRVSAARAN